MIKDLKIVFGKFLDFIFTKRCEFCGEVIEYDAVICDECRKLPINKEPLCESCGVSKLRCNCDKKKHEYKQIVAPYIYEDKVKTAIHNFKTVSMPFLSNRFAKDIAKCVKSNYKDISFDYITFIPVSKKTFKKRDYNQAYLIATKLSKLLDVEVLDILVKVSKTKPQKSLSAKERKVNVYGAFDLKDKSAVKDKTFLIIDDVKTTGSTLNECSKMLNIYGAKAVYAATLAVAPPKKKE